jgi:hypothetical protein
MDPGTPFDSARVDALLDARGATALPGGGRRWKLEHGEVELHPLREGGEWVATEVRVSLSDRTDLIREVVSRATELASEAGVGLVDPQLGRALSHNDEGPVTEKYERTARYAGEMLGVASAMPLPSAESEGFQPTTRFILAVAGAFFLLYWVMRWLDGQLGG